jgi:hypothetical protein
MSLLEVSQDRAYVSHGGELHAVGTRRQQIPHQDIFKDNETDLQEIIQSLKIVRPTQSKEH